MHDTPRRARQVLGVLIPLLILAAGCGGEDDDATATTTSTTANASEADGDATEVAAVDYAFEDLPARVEAGTTLALENRSEEEVHELVAFALPEGDVRTAEEILALPEDELSSLFFEAEPAMVLIAPPGEGSFAAVGDGTLNDPGRYVVFCAIPLGADPAEYLEAARDAQDGPPDVPGGPPHFTQGMYGDFVVE